MAEAAQTLAVITAIKAALTVGSGDMAAKSRKGAVRRLAKGRITNNLVCPEFAPVLHQFGRDAFACDDREAFAAPFSEEN